MRGAYSLNNTALQQISDASFLEKTGVEHPAAVVMKRRIRLLVRIIHHAPLQLRSLLVSDNQCCAKGKAWLSFVTRDLDEIHAQFDLFDELGRPSLFPLAWHSYITSFPRQFIAACDKAIKCMIFCVPKAKGEAEKCGSFPCPICGKMFSSVHVVNGHICQFHKKKNQFRSRMAGSNCLCCLKQFWTRPRLLNHF